MKVGDLVKFKDVTGDFPGIRGDLAMVVQSDLQGIVVEWLNDGRRDNAYYYSQRCPFTSERAWWEVISSGR